MANTDATRLRVTFTTKPSTVLPTSGVRLGYVTTAPLQSTRGRYRRSSAKRHRDASEAGS
jgi:hypothetical protein